LSCLFHAEAKSAQAVSPNAAAGASAPMLLFENDASASFSNLFHAEAKSAQAVSPNAAAGASAPMLLFENDASASFSNFLLRCLRKLIHNSNPGRSRSKT
jgi:hypothetical protein